MLEEGGREQLGLGGATKIGDTGVSQNGGEKKGEEAREEEEKSCAIGWRRKRERESKKKSEVPVSCLLQGSQRHETKGTPPARKEQRR